MKPVNPRHFLDDQFPRALRPLIPATLRTAYRAAEDLIADNPILSMAEIRGERGRLVSYAVDFAFNRLVESGALPFDKSWEFFERPTGRYLALRASHSVITISQIADPTKQPRNVLFRQSARTSNAPFFDLPEFAEEDDVVGEPHILITHGYQALSFAHLCMPDPDHRNGYRFRSENLLNLPHVIAAEGPPPEDTDVDFESIELLKEDIDRHRRDHGDE
jgi:hypothetical protein